MADGTPSSSPSSSASSSPSSSPSEGTGSTSPSNSPSEGTPSNTPSASPSASGTTLLGAQTAAATSAQVNPGGKITIAVSHGVLGHNETVTVYGEDGQGYFNIELYKFKNNTPSAVTLEYYLGLKVVKTATATALAVAYGVPA